MANPLGITGPSRTRGTAAHRLGARAEQAAHEWLLRQGADVWEAGTSQQHPDFFVRWPDGSVQAVEVRIEHLCRVRRKGHERRGERWVQRRRRKTDRCDAYLWVSRDLNRFELERVDSAPEEPEQPQPVAAAQAPSARSPEVEEVPF